MQLNINSSRKYSREFKDLGLIPNHLYYIETYFMSIRIQYTKMDQAEGDYMRKIAKKQAIKVNLKELVLVSTTLKVAELSKVKILYNNVIIMLI